MHPELLDWLQHLAALPNAEPPVTTGQSHLAPGVGGTGHRYPTFLALHGKSGSEEKCPVERVRQAANGWTMSSLQIVQTLGDGR